MAQPPGNRSVRREPDPVELAAYLLPVVLLVNSLNTPYLLTLNLVFAAAIFAVADLRRSPWTFLALAACWAPDLVLRWFRHEDHVYLAVYWCLALGLSRLSADPVRTLRTHARLLIGLCFAFAVVAKIRAPEFLDGTLFHHILLVDHRFRDAITTTLGGLNSGMVVENARMLASLNRLPRTRPRVPRTMAAHRPHRVLHRGVFRGPGRWLRLPLPWDGRGAVPARPITSPPYVCGALFRFAQLGVRSPLHLHGQFGDLTRVMIVGQCPRPYRRSTGSRVTMSHRYTSEDCST